MVISEEEVKKNVIFLRNRVLKNQTLYLRDMVIETTLLAVTSPIGVEIVFVFLNLFKGIPIEFRPVRFLGILGFSLVAHPVRLIFLKRKWRKLNPVDLN